MLNDWLKVLVQEYHTNPGYKKCSDIKRDISNFQSHTQESLDDHVDLLKQLELALKLIQHKDDNDLKRANREE